MNGKIRYMTEDDAIFKTLDEAEEYQKRLESTAEIRERVEKYLEMKDFKTEGSRKRALTYIMGWIQYDLLEQSAEDYVDEGQVEIPVVARVTEA